MAAPTITSISPAGGPFGGATPVVIRGTGFVTGLSLTFGGSGASAIIIVDDMMVTCRTPAHAVGAVNVVLTNPDTLSATSTNGFTYGTNQWQLHALAIKPRAEERA